ncbi:hypothetical protein H1235_10680 [Pseudoxanthomonas sp. NC8]|nr:hypothetical protein H1235_10680 [Pseudoxanthomonas sp. NC8]
MVEAPRASGSGSPRYLIQVRGRGFAGYTKTTDRTGLVMPVAVVMIVMAMPVADAQPRFRRDGGRVRWLAFTFDMVANKTASAVRLSSVAMRHQRKPFPLRKKQLAAVHRHMRLAFAPGTQSPAWCGRW